MQILDSDMRPQNIGRVFLYCLFGILGMDNAVAYCAPWNIVIVGLNSLYCYKMDQATHSVKSPDEVVSYDPSEQIWDPIYFHDGEGKIFYAKNTIAERNGYLLLYDNNANKISQVYHGDQIYSLCMSPNKKMIAFLSNSENSAYLLLIYNMQSKQITSYDVRIKKGGAYNKSISWAPDSDKIFYTNIDGIICSFDLINNKIVEYFKGYDPLCSPDGKKMLFKKEPCKPYIINVYTFLDGTTMKIRMGDVYNATWSPDSNGLFVVLKGISSFSWKALFSLSEWRKHVLYYDLTKMNKIVLFNFEGFEFIDVH